MALIDIPTAVHALVSFFALGGTAAAKELAEKLLTNVSMKVADFWKLKDELLQMQDVAEQIRAFQKNPQHPDLQAQLPALLTQKLEQHPSFQQNVEVHGDITANNGSVAVGANKGDIRIKNNFK
jgi:hypothetical protein